jgi:hypothetical protein
MRLACNGQTYSIKANQSKGWDANRLAESPRQDGVKPQSRHAITVPPRTVVRERRY